MTHRALKAPIEVRARNADLAQNVRPGLRRVAAPLAQGVPSGLAAPLHPP